MRSAGRVFEEVDGGVGEAAESFELRSDDTDDAAWVCIAAARARLATSPIA